MTKKKRKKCSCVGRSGEPKRLYRTQRGAASAALRTGRTGAFCTYRCPEHRDMWHLTHG